MKKLIALALVAMTIVTMAILPPAVGAQKPVQTHDDLLNSIISLDDAKKITDVVDIYFTFVDSEMYDFVVSDETDFVGLYHADPKASHFTTESLGEFAVKKLEKLEVNKRIDEPIVRRALERAQKMMALGNEVAYINVFLPKTSIEPTRADYWEQNSIYWGYGYGHHWRYYYMQTSVNSNPQLGPISQHPSNWPAIRAAMFKVLVDRVVDGVTSGAWSVVTDMASILSAANPTNYTFSPAQGEELSAGSTGFIFHKDIVIQDTLNKISGYNYWPWGTVERVELDNYIRVKWWNQSNQDWGIEFKVAPRQISKTPLYDSVSPLWEKVAYKYSLLGYNYYYEFILFSTSHRGKIE